MRRITLYRKGLWHHRRTNVAVVLGVATGAAVLTGALVVGDSMRGSLRARALEGLGRIDARVSAQRFFREALADDLTRSVGGRQRFSSTAPIIALRGAAEHADSGAVARRMNVLGVDDRFWTLQQDPSPKVPPTASGTRSPRRVILNQRLATDIGAQVGDDVLLRVAKPSDIALETLLGRRDDTTRSLRLTVDGIVPNRGLGAFAPTPQQSSPRNAYVPLSVLQAALEVRGRANSVLLEFATDPPADRTAGLADIVAAAATLDDAGLRVRVDESHGYVALETDAMLLVPPIEKVAVAAARRINSKPVRVLTYLANAIIAKRSVVGLVDRGETHSGDGGSRMIPYSTVAAIEPFPEAQAAWISVDGDEAAWPGAGEIVLNDWAARDLDVAAGDSVELAYYQSGPLGTLTTARESFVLRDVVRLAGSAADPGFTPDYPGMTEARTIADWDPPFPVDLNLVRDKDEAYWDAHRATPKAFVLRQDGVRLWAREGDRFGSVTSIRLYPKPGDTVAALADRFRDALHEELDIASMGLSVDPVRQRAMQSARGSTDFGGLFIGFSFFLIGSAAMLVALLFRLGIERRAKEIGLLLALGFSARTVSRMLLIEGCVLAVVATAMGQLGASAYAGLMLTGLRTWWTDAVNAPFLQLHVSGASIAIGMGGGLLTAMIAMAWAVRGVCKIPVAALLAGAANAGPTPQAQPSKHFSIWVAVACGAMAVALVALNATLGTPSRSIAFFCSGGSALIAVLALVKRWLGSQPHHVIREPGVGAWVRLGIRNAPRHPGRSVLTVSLIASATFLITSLEAFRLEPESGDTTSKTTGSGGFALFAESTTPLAYDLNTQEGRANLNISESTSALLESATVIPFRLRTGEETSCLNLYQPGQPRIIGATKAMLERGGFSFASSIAETAEDEQNPWRLLDRSLDDRAIPVIGDESAVLWQLHSGLGKEIEIEDENGNPVRLRFVALLGGSALQGELVVSERSFTRMFPSVGGYAFFLIAAPRSTVRDLSTALEKDLSPFGFDAGLVTDRLRDYFGVQNTYLSTFQALGGLGLVMGTIGLIAVMLRNVWERRRELALFQALGFSRRAIGTIVLAENAVLVVLGLLAGFLPSLLAVAPHLLKRAASLPWTAVGATCAGVLVVGILAGAAALVPALRAPLIPALRSE